MQKVNDYRCNEEISDYWIVDVTQSCRMKVSFDKEVTRKEAIELVQNEQWEDVLDEQDQMIVDVHDAKAL